jgi:hypothetical protein
VRSRPEPARIARPRHVRQLYALEEIEQATLGDLQHHRERLPLDEPTSYVEHVAQLEHVEGRSAVSAIRKRSSTRPPPSSITAAPATHRREGQSVLMTVPSTVRSSTSRTGVVGELSRTKALPSMRFEVDSLEADTPCLRRRNMPWVA